jgi:glycosyltransferase involved in cell wall biosynthesis
VLLRNILANAVRLIELLGCGFIDSIIYAEQGYIKEMPLRLNRKAVIIRNTYTDIWESDFICKERGKKISILYSGTIAENYGIYNAINFIDHFYKKYPVVELLIVGHCANKKTLKKVISLIQEKSYITLIGGDVLVPHEDIIRHIQAADFGLVCYNINPSIENCFPTKIYEYMANRLPVIIQNYRPWSSFCLEHHAGFEVNFKEIDYDQLYSALKNQTFYNRELPKDIYWKEDEKKLLNLIDNILS